MDQPTKPPEMEKDERVIYCEICTTLPVDERPPGRKCHNCGKYACDSHGSWVDFRWYCKNCT